MVDWSCGSQYPTNIRTLRIKLVRVLALNAFLIFLGNRILKNSLNALLQLEGDRKYRQKRANYATAIFRSLKLAVDLRMCWTSRKASATVKFSVLERSGISSWRQARSSKNENQTPWLLDFYTSLSNTDSHEPSRNTLLIKIIHLTSIKLIHSRILSTKCSENLFFQICHYFKGLLILWLLILI